MTYNVGKENFSRKFVLKISGRFISPDNTGYIRRLASMLRSLYDEGYRFTIVVGGGETARKYIEAGRVLMGSEALLDMMGIIATRLNAALLIAALKEYSYPLVPTNLNEFHTAWATGRIVVCGGFQPGQSTNAVSAIIAESISANRIINATTVDAVYSGDPKINPNAKALRKANIDDLYKLLFEKSQAAGGYELFDHVSLGIMRRSRIKALIVYGGDVERIMRAIKYNEAGTIVIP